MSEETRILPEHFTEFLPLLADDVLDGIAACIGRGWKKWINNEPPHKFKPEEYAEVERAANYVVMALQMGLLLAKRQPELVEVPISDLRAKGGSVDELWQGMMEAYQGFLRICGYERPEKDKINPNHFEEFLSYYASTWLREMSKQMDKEWQKGWQKRAAPLHRFKPRERAKIDMVGNYVVLAILSGLLIVKKQPELLGVDWSRGASLDMLWEGMLRTYQSFMYYKSFVERKAS